MGVAVLVSWWAFGRPKNDGVQVYPVPEYGDLQTIDHHLPGVGYLYRAAEESSSGEGLPRGIRNNNPGNIEYTGDQWKGLAELPHDGRYCIFVDPIYGIRAMARILKSYQRRGIDTLGDIISTWAPSFENNTISYIDGVSQRSGYAKNARIGIEDWPEIIEAMIHHENGIQPYTMGTIKAGISLA